MTLLDGLPSCRGVRGARRHTSPRKATCDAINRRTTRYPGYEVSQRVRHRGLARVEWVFTFTAAAYNLERIRNLQAARA